MTVLADTFRGFINVTLSYGGGFAYLKVRDSGVGVPDSGECPSLRCERITNVLYTDVAKIFDRFYRVDVSPHFSVIDSVLPIASQSISRSHEGTGIGLALTKVGVHEYMHSQRYSLILFRTQELVKLHGGSLTVESQTEEVSLEAHGSCFTVTIPLGKDHLYPSQVQDLPEVPQNRLYGQGLVDEATHWDVRTFDERTPSEASDSGASGSGNSSDSSKMDPSTLFFVESDVILLGMSPFIGDIPFFVTL